MAGLVAELTQPMNRQPDLSNCAVSHLDAGTGSRPRWTATSSLSAANPHIGGGRTSARPSGLANLADSGDREVGDVLRDGLDGGRGQIGWLPQPFGNRIRH